MVSEEPEIRNAQIFHTAETVAGPTGAPPALINGNIIEDDKVRYMMEFNCFNTDVAYHVITIYAGDAVNTKRRVIFEAEIPPGVNAFHWPANPKPNAYALKVVPVTAAGVATQENGIYFADDTVPGAVITNIRMSYLDKRA